MASPTDYNWPLAAAAILFEKGLNKEAMLEIEKVKNLEFTSAGKFKYVISKI